jgi:hypothetical protein
MKTLSLAAHFSESMRGLSRNKINRNVAQLTDPTYLAQPKPMVLMWTTGDMKYVICGYRGTEVQMELCASRLADDSDVLAFRNTVDVP